MAGQETEIPSLRGLPLPGHAVRLMREPLPFVSDLRSRGPIVGIRIGTAKVLFVNHPDLVREMLVDKAYAFNKGRHFERLRPWWGNGLATSEGDFHLRQRRLAQPAFHRQQIASYVRVIQETAEEAISGWPADRPIQLDRELYRLLVAMVARNLFATTISDEVISRLQDALIIILEGTGWRTLDPTNLLDK